MATSHQTHHHHHRTSCFAPSLVASSYLPQQLISLWVLLGTKARTALDGTPYNLLLLDNEGIDAYDQTQYEWLIRSQYNPVELAKSDVVAIRKPPPCAIDSWGLGKSILLHFYMVA
ncbi:hypothetical protein NC653_038357 [Populus alba x Populus x berolinensis]|uniref:Uncharacterized protein n=1 Tax=Populus alba x Populus x berolinensis TaxID=444605 RepID=A0AAD6LGM4_9ROSI|nr:hypothetical protein NC653_038357 [Populus alba x Populus x berolinensis]